MLVICDLQSALHVVEPRKYSQNTLRKNKMKGIYTAIVATFGLLLANKCNAVFDTFIGPGVVECNQGECEFTVKAGRGCIDPCHTQTHYHMYDMSFIDIADVSVDPSNDNTIDEPCSFTYAKHIDAHYPDQYVDIEEGCTAKCSGCIFAPTVIFRKTLNFTRIDTSRVIC